MVPVSAEKMSEIDERARTEYGISQEFLMERAGVSIAESVLLDISPEGSKHIIVICGKGNNGGDGFVAARHLFSRGYPDVDLYFPGTGEVKSGATFDNLKKAVSAGILLKELSSVLEDFSAFPRDLIVVDALLGTGYKGAMTGLYAEIAEKVNLSGAKIFSADVPSGLDATTGEILGKCFKAFRTVTFGLPKTGFYKQKGPEFCGEIVVADIGFPQDLVKEFL